LAELYERAGRRADSAEVLADLARRRPWSGGLHYEAGLLFNSVESFEHALPLLTRACALEPRRSRNHGELAVTLAAVGRYEEALSALDVALALEPDNQIGWENRRQLLVVCAERATASSERTAKPTTDALPICQYPRPR
jgi:Flp pilus assembly protein TadD